MSSKPLRCRMGLHRWFWDCAMFTSARRCNYCGTYADKADAEALAHERRTWSSEGQYE